MRLSKYWNLPGLPCVSVTVQGSVKAVAVINMIGCCMCALMVTRDIITREGFAENQTISITSETQNNSTEDAAKHLIKRSLSSNPLYSEGTSATIAFHYLTWILLYMKDVVDFIVSIFLITAVQSRNLFYCKLYFFSTFLVLQAYTVYLIDVSVLRLTYTITVSVVIGFCFHVFYKPYSIWVILNFMKVVIEEDKEKEGKVRHSQRRLTDAELEDFYKGSSMLSTVVVSTVQEISKENLFTEDVEKGEKVLNGNYTSWNEKLNGVTEGSTSPYVRNDMFIPLTMKVRNEPVLCSFKKEYELDRTEFTIDESKILGSGEFGTVFRGMLNKHDENFIPKAVAVKTTLCTDDVDTDYFKALLDEIKVMCYIGIHPNIVNLEGVCTSDIANRNIWIVMELCEKGSLEKYLRSNKNCFKEVGSKKSNHRCMLKSAEYMKHITREEVTITTLDLVKWAHEIGLGMEFLVQKKVCHGDLALRNILLMGDRTAKISDFGLARKLYNYALYAKDEETALPWRYMAPESLRNLTFSQQTDVWTYGVTLWELFSFGDTPWGNYEYSVEFVSAILGGSRLPRPTKCPPQMYAIMEGCWNLDENTRPTFSHLVFHTKILYEVFDKLAKE